MAMGDSVVKSIYRLARQERGSVLIQIGLTIFVLMGFGGLALDLGRAFTLNTELQQAADAAALAAAAELDGFTGAQTRATAAATAFAVNNQTFATDGGPPAISIASITFLSCIDKCSTVASTATLLPPTPNPVNDAVATGDADSVYVRVVTQARSVTGVLASFVSTKSVFSTTAVATAARLPLVCLDTPAMVCSPTNGDPFSFTPGTQLHLKAGDVAPGNFSLLCPPSGPCGAKGDGGFLATASATGNSCTSNIFLPTSTGVKVSVEQGLNTRFDIFSGSFKNTDNATVPANNVTKGYVIPVAAHGPPSTACDATAAASPNAMALPRDSNFDPTTGVGNGDWSGSRQAYWNVNHATAAQPTAPTSQTVASTTYDLTKRYGMYQWENASANIPDPNPTTGTTLENGATTGASGAMCYKGNQTPTADRRLLNLAIVNCAPLKGASVDARPLGYMQVFVTEPANPDFYFEIVKVYSFSNPTGPIHNNVRLVR